MGALIISLLTLVLILISGFIVLLVLMQRTSQSGGMGAALGGGAAESAFGADTNNVLTKGTIYGIIAFFVVSLGLYLVYQGRDADKSVVIDTETLITSTEEAEETAETVTAVDAALPAIEEIALDSTEEGTVEASAESEELSVEVEAPVAPEAPVVEEAAPTPSN
ncbi:MAG: preprotein translocase subunit SecG [Puniceicoccaceae bacterium]|nr:preprotein translocase subunit SecG [Puniceicoccaceae bacterium]NQY33307.1 preprotein translocase subunit SecG [Coraliomargarita sp.]